jgi:hypothetical protein
MTSPLLPVLAIIALALYIVFGYFYKQEPKKFIVAAVIVLLVLVLWIFGLPRFSH